MEYKIITPDEYRKMLWKNRRGATTELFVKDNPDTDKYIYRISIAGVTEDGQFSDFSGYDRTLIMLEGNGIVLTHSDGKKNELRTISDIATFSGDVKTEANLINGPIKDFNVMTLREKCRSITEITEGTFSYEITGKEIFIYGHFSDNEIEFSGNKITLNRYHLLHIKSDQKFLIRLTGRSIITQVFYN